MSANLSPAPRLGYAVFSDENTVWFLKALKRGFRHCALIIRDEARPRAWLVVDPLSDQLLIDAVAPPENAPDLPTQLEQAGCRLVRVSVPAHGARGKAVFSPFTCVEVVKRMLGVRGLNILTPYQLYRHLLTPNR
jgi:hypothetical protein